MLTENQALRDLEADPMRPGCHTRPELVPQARTYHLSFSRNSVAGPRVKAPRHLIVYRVGPASLDVARILHDSRDRLRHVPEVYLS